MPFVTVPVPSTPIPVENRSHSFGVRVTGGMCWVNAEVADRHGLVRDGAALSRFVDALLDARAAVRETFKDDGKSLVQRIEQDGRSWVVKRYGGSPRRTSWFHLVRRTPAWREWRYGQLLHRRGLRVIQPIALVHFTDSGRWRQALITRFVDGPSLHHWLKKCPPVGSLDRAQQCRRLAVASAVGRQVGQITSVGYTNRDHKVSNLVVDKECERGGDPTLIDPARIKRRRRDDQVYLMVARLWRSARRAGEVTSRERLAVLRALLESDASLEPAGRHRLRTSAERIDRIDQRLQQMLETNRRRSAR